MNKKIIKILVFVFFYDTRSPTINTGPRFLFLTIIAPSNTGYGGLGDGVARGVTCHASGCDNTRDIGHIRNGRWNRRGHITKKIHSDPFILSVPSFLGQGRRRCALG